MLVAADLSRLVGFLFRSSQTRGPTFLLLHVTQLRGFMAADGAAVGG
jgi:hypothetical protein